MSYSLTWDLDSIFSGGSHSSALKTKMEQIQKEINEFKKDISKWDATEQQIQLGMFQKIVSQQGNIEKGLEQCGSFIISLQASNVADKKAGILLVELQTLASDFQNAYTLFSQKITSIPDTIWNQYVQSPELKKLAFRLQEVRREGKELLSESEEKIISKLSIDGFNAWSSHYDTIVASITIPFTEENGTQIELSAGQAFNRMMGDSSPSVRRELFEKWEIAWSEKAPLFADTLNHLDGFRLANYSLHGVSNFLKEPLEYNRMQQATLDMMWETINKNKTIFVDYLTRKAQLFGKEKMEWQDQDAPILLGNLTERNFSFDEAARFILENFQTFSPKMASFAKEAFEKSWIEAEDRSGKRPGGYCTGFPESKESRIFMTYGESINEVATLAHELGHAFHSSVMWDLPKMNQDYAMNVAETASTFAELIVADATLKQAQTPEEKLNLLDTKMQNAIAMFLNIHSRFIFETNYYAARQKGILSEDEITEMMLSAQKEGYAESLATYHPHFWCSKLHFYFDEVPFYNFPYTFGYMFSLGIYAYANQHTGNFEDQYIALLRDTASMTTEELAQKHLGVDLTQPDFWQAGIDQVKKDIDEFLTISEAFI